MAQHKQPSPQLRRRAEDFLTDRGLSGAPASTAPTMPPGASGHAWRTPGLAPPAFEHSARDTGGRHALAQPSAPRCR
jgi:hypothetical protein